MTQTQFRTPRGVTFKQPVEIEGELFEEPAAEPGAPAPEPEPVKWMDLPDYQADPDSKFEVGLYPYNGVAIWVTPDGVSAVPTVWRTTRGYDAKSGVWKYCGFWARRNSGGLKLNFTPIGYRELKD